MGRIVELLAERDSGGSGIAVIDVFAVAATRHERFGMPYLIRRQVNPSFVIVDTKAFLISIDASYVNIDLDCPGY